MKLFTRSKLATLTALTTSVLAAGAIAAPTASAAPVQVARLTPLIGLGGGDNLSVGSAELPIGVVNETITVLVDQEQPGVSFFDASSWCPCQLEWKNEDTGATGISMVGSGALFPKAPTRVVTGSGRITTTSSVPYGITFLPAVGSWQVP
ncbi:MAG: hypothetical protein WBA81_12495 [Rhodococcus sp. (in: high G+C Gram-positive bacteria)]